MIIYEEMLRAFQKEKIKYALVGGLAVNLLGSLRNTADMDIVVEMSDENLSKIVTVLKKQGYRVKQPVDPMSIADADTRAYWIEKKHMKAFNFYKEAELKEVDIIIETPRPYDKIKKRLVRIKSKDINIPVIGINDLIAMKENTGREIDARDIGELKRIKKLKKIR